MRRAVPAHRLPSLEPDQGLSAAEAADRLRRFGPNRILETGGGGWRELLRDTARDPMLWFLLTTAGLFLAVGDVAEAIILLLALIPLAGMDAFLHRRTRASTEGLQSRLANRATVFRDGSARELPATELVPGDLVVVATGQPFPADGLVVAGDQLQADESSLTGEAWPVRKQPLTTLPPGEEPSLPGEHWGLAGTRLLTGEARLRVAYTAGETLYGEIVRSALEGGHGRTPLQNAIAGLVTVLVSAALVFCLLLAIVRLQQGHGLVDALISALTLAVAALPEEFPVVFTFFLGVGVYRLARRQALVRRAVAVENIGRVSAVGSDKTGTLTEGRLRIGHLFPAEGGDEAALLITAACASRVESGDPLDTAILEAAPAPDGERLATYPFTEDRRRESGVWLRPGGPIVAALKGAPETVLALCELQAEQRAGLQQQVERLSTEGHKVIACAKREFPARAEWPGGEPERGYRFMGLLALEDPIREGARESVAECRDAGIHVLMITGDHPATARAIATELGLGGGTPQVFTAEQLDDEPQRPLREVDVVARAVPSQKLALVRRLQGAGEIVAVTGDGVNDVPALQAADVGVAMGGRGTRSAREVAAIVLMDDNFRTLVRAVAEGRQLFQNLRTAFAYLLMVHIPLVISAALIPLAGFSLLYLPVHIVWLELIIHPTALLVFQELPAEVPLARAPRSRRLRFFNAREWVLIGLVGGLLTIAVVSSYRYGLGLGNQVEHARALALAVLTLGSAAITAGLTRLRSRAARSAVLAIALSSLFLIQVPLFSGLLHMQPLHLDDWLLAVSFILPTFFLPALSWRRNV